MKCPNHITRDVAGYCSVCGSFFCQDCLTRHEGNLFCKKHYKPIQSKLNRDQKISEGKRRRARHALVVHFRNGQHAQGVCRAMNIRDSGFHLECENTDGTATGETLRIRFEDLKCVCNVKSYDGNFDPSESFPEYAPGGEDVVIEFRDGEILEGKTMNLYNPDHPRFYVIPKELDSNNINVLIESSAVSHIYTPEQYAAKLTEEKEVKPVDVARSEGQERVELGQEESMGDFYFEQRSYQPAFEQYLQAREVHPESARIRKKTVVAAVNVGIGHIKTRDYPAALQWMEQALDIEPDNPHALKKAKQLRKVIEKTQRRMQAYMEGTLDTDMKSKKED